MPVYAASGHRGCKTATTRPGSTQAEVPTESVTSSRARGEVTEVSVSLSRRSVDGDAAREGGLRLLQGEGQSSRHSHAKDERGIKRTGDAPLAWAARMNSMVLLQCRHRRNKKARASRGGARAGCSPGAPMRHRPASSPETSSTPDSSSSDSTGDVALRSGSGPEHQDIDAGILCFGVQF
jgi:hypothetical protein